MVLVHLVYGDIAHLAQQSRQGFQRGYRVVNVHLGAFFNQSVQILGITGRHGEMKTSIRNLLREKQKSFEIAAAPCSGQFDRCVDRSVERKGDENLFCCNFRWECWMLMSRFLIQTTPLLHLHQTNPGVRRTAWERSPSFSVHQPWPRRGRKIPPWSRGQWGWNRVNISLPHPNGAWWRH